jgi:mono/diheme cytochrome c family protein
MIQSGSGSRAARATVVGAVAMALLTAAARADAAGVDVYSANCAVCHGADARGGIGPNIRCKTSIAGPVRNGKGSMPAFPASVISDADLAATLAYLQSLCASATTTTLPRVTTTTVPRVTTTTVPHQPTTTLPQTTTTTLPAPPPAVDCTTVDECRQLLATVLPGSDGARATRSRRVTRLLARLRRKAERALDRLGATAADARQERLYGTVQNTLTRLLTVATSADAQGKLGVPLAPIENAVTRLLDMLGDPTAGGGGGGGGAGTAGVVLYDGSCATCHGVDARGGVGPDIRCQQGILGTVRNGKGGMPAFAAAQLSDADVGAIEDFLATFCAPAPATTTTVPAGDVTTTTQPPNGGGDDD